MSARSERRKIHVGERSGDVSALFVEPRAAKSVLALAHGAGADMRHAFMESAACALAERGVATLRYQFPYTEKGKRAPSPRPLLLATVRAALREAEMLAGGRPIFAGGKSMGARMSSLVASEQPADSDAQPCGLVFLGFPLHPAGKPGRERADHLRDVSQPMLFLQGTRDKLADLDLLRPVCAELGARSTLHEVEGADHSFHVLERSGRTDAEVLDEICERAAAWMECRVVPGVRG